MEKAFKLAVRRQIVRKDNANQVRKLVNNSWDEPAVTIEQAVDKVVIERFGSLA